MVDSAKMAIYLYPGKILADHLSIKSHLRDAPRDTHGATADYDDTALGTGTLTVHPWRAGPDCGKLLLLLLDTTFLLLVGSKHGNQATFNFSSLDPTK